MPASIRVREVQVQVDQPGFRVDSFVVVTTLTDADSYSHDDLAELYHQRWLAELDIRTIKITLGLDVLRCKSPEMVRREIWTGLLAYNLIRKTMLQAAMQAGRSPRANASQIAGTTTLQVNLGKIIPDFCGQFVPEVTEPPRCTKFIHPKPRVYHFL